MALISHAVMSTLMIAHRKASSQQDTLVTDINVKAVCPLKPKLQYNFEQPGRWAGVKYGSLPRPKLPPHFGGPGEDISPIHDYVCLFRAACPDEAFQVITCCLRDERSWNCEISQIPAHTTLISCCQKAANGWSRPLSMLARGLADWQHAGERQGPRFASSTSKNKFAAC